MRYEINFCVMYICISLQMLSRTVMYPYIGLVLIATIRHRLWRRLHDLAGRRQAMFSMRKEL